jgi:Bacterial Ig-like domain (group 1)
MGPYFRFDAKSEGSLMKNRSRLTLLLLNGCLSLGMLPLHGQVSVLTHHYDISRSGLNPNETLLTPANVNANHFGPLFSQGVDGFVVGQPLYLPGVSIPNQGTHNVVYVTTQNDSVYAFDADTLQAPLWTTSLLYPSGTEAVPVLDQGCGGGNVTQFTQIGITGTPVIDPTTNTMYVVGKTVLPATGVQSFYLHALDVTTGEEKFGGPSEITGSVVGATGTVTFTPRYQMQRPGLLESNGTIYIAFGSVGCDLYAHGWVFAYSAYSSTGNGLPQLAIFATTPDSTADTEEGSIWQGGGGLPADSSGNVYAMTANGDFDAYLGGNDYGDSFIQLSLGADGFSLIDSFTPYDQQQMRNQDLDLGSGGPILLNNQPGSIPNLVVGAGKLGTIYLLNQSNLGGYNSGGSGDTQIVQWLPSVLGGPMFGTPAYWNNMVYFSPADATLKAFALSTSTGIAQFSTTPVLQTTKLGGVATPVISANGTTNAVLWMVQVPPKANAVLTAWNASTLGAQIFPPSSVKNPNNLNNLAAHFVAPTVANGKVYVGTQSTLVAFALFQALGPYAGNNQSAPVGTTLPAVLQVLVADPYSGNVDAGVTVTFSDNGAGGTFGSPTAVTNSSGIATTTYTLPQTVGTVTISASGSGGSFSNYGPTNFSEIATSLPPASLSCLGANQNGTVGTALPMPITSTVKDANGNPVSGASVGFTDNGAGGTFSGNPVITNSSGKASVGYTTGTKAGTVKITISVSGVTPVTISEKNIAGAPASVNIVSGNNQSGNPSTTLPKALEVSVTDQYSNPVSGVSVGFSDGGAGGTLSSSSVTTNLQGTASVSYTLPGSAETVNVSASVTGLTSAVLTETVE